MSTFAAQQEVSKQVSTFLRALTLSPDPEVVTVATDRWREELRRLEELERQATSGNDQKAA